MEFTLKRANLWSRFEGRIFSGEDVSQGKPAPDLFLHAASVLGFKEEDCIVVEDSWAGVTAALAANMKVIAYTGGITSIHQFPAGEATMIDHMSQLPGAILELIGN